MSVTCDRLVLFSGWQPQYHWNIVESGVKHHKPKPKPNLLIYGTRGWYFCLFGIISRYNFNALCMFLRKESLNSVLLFKCPYNFLWEIILVQNKSQSPNLSKWKESCVIFLDIYLPWHDKKTYRIRKENEHALYFSARFYHSSIERCLHKQEPKMGSGRRDHDHMVVGFTTTYAISAYHH